MLRPDTVRLARGAAAASAMLVLLTPVILHNCGGCCVGVPPASRRWEERRQPATIQLRLADHTVEQAQATVPKLSFGVIDPRFNTIEDRQKRSYFMELPTSFSLPPDAVDQLCAVSNRLLRESPQSRSMLARIAIGMAQLACR